LLSVKCRWMSIVDCDVASTDPRVLYVVVNKRVQYKLGFAAVQVNVAR